MASIKCPASGFPTPGWCVELQGDALDIAEWQHDLKPPFDPWIERIEHTGREIVVLRSKAFNGVETPEGTQGVGSAVLDRLQGALQIISGHRADIEIGASVFVDDKGHVRATYVLLAGTATFRIAEAPERRSQPFYLDLESQALRLCYNRSLRQGGNQAD